MSTTEFRADLAQAPAPVRVKPLVWHQISETPERWVGHQSDVSNPDYVIHLTADSPDVYGWGLDGDGWQGFSDTLEAAKSAARQDYEQRILAALEAPVAAPVRVRALEWVDFHDRGAKAQAWNEANYMIQKWSDGRWEISASYPGYSTFIYGTDRFYPTLEAAKAAAQADYEARILAALEAPDAGVVAELVEALRGLLALLDAGSLYEPQAYRAREILAKLELRA